MTPSLRSESSEFSTGRRLYHDSLARQRDFQDPFQFGAAYSAHPVRMRTDTTTNHASLSGYPGQDDGDTDRERAHRCRPSATLAEYLTIEELAEQLRISPRTIRRWRTLRIGPPHLKCGPRRVLYKLEHVRDWLDSQAAGGAQK